MSACRCHHPETLDLTATQSRWALPLLRYWQSVSEAGVNPARLAAAYAAACRSWEAVAGVRFALSESPGAAQIVAVSAPIDGPWNVLAVSELPPTASYAGVLHQTFDSAEQLDDDELLAMFAHELGHILGLGHLAPGNLMAAILDPAITSPQPGDVAEAQARYGPPLSTPQTAVATLDCQPVEVTITVPEPGTYAITFTPTAARKL